MVHEEFRMLGERTAALASRVAFDFFATGDTALVETCLATPNDLLHYAGHV